MGKYHSHFLQRNAKLNTSVVQIIKSGILSVLGAAQKFNNILNSKTWSYFLVCCVCIALNDTSDAASGKINTTSLKNIT